MNIKKVSKQIQKYYFSHNQHLVVDTWEMREDTNNDCCFDIYLADSDIYLFMIRNYTAFNDIRAVDKTYFKENRYRWIKYWNGAEASYSPLYVDQVFTLPKFTRITEADIVGATNYFIHEVLHMWGIFNVSIEEQKKEQNEAL
jgi:hypothetical protein